MRPQPLRAELVKLRRAAIWTAYILLPLIASAMGTFNYQQNLGVLTPGWDNLWSQHTLFEFYFFLPALVGTGCSWLMRLEHAGTNWNQVLASPADPARLVAAKLFVGAGMLAVALAATGGLLVFFGKTIGLPGLPPTDYALHLLLAWVGGVPMVAVQLLISSLVRTFAVPVGIAMAGGVSGMLLSAKGLGLWWPWALMPLAANGNVGDGLAAFLAMAAIFTMVGSAACTRVMGRAAASSG